MDAETAGGESVNHATELSTSAAADKSTETQEQPQELDTSRARVKSILELDGFSDEEVSEVVKPKEKPNADTETSQSDQTAGEEAGDRKAAATKASEIPGSKTQAPKKDEKDGKTKDEGAGKDDKEEALTPEEQKTWPPEALDRIHKLTRQREEWKAKASARPEPAAPRPAPSAQDPLADVRTPEEWQRVKQEYLDLREWAQQNPDGVTDEVIGQNADGTPKTRDYSAKDMAAIVAKTTRILDEHLPTKAQLLALQSQHEQIAREKLPEMFEKGTEPNRFYNRALEEVSGLTSIQGYPNWIRWSWMGRLLDIGAKDDPQLEAAVQKVRDWIGVKNSAAAAAGNGKDKLKVSKAAAPFLQKHGPLAPGVPAARATTEQARRTAATSEEVNKAQERVNEGGGEDAEVDLVSALRKSQAPERGVPV